jgi:hypothetical protein
MARSTSAASTFRPCRAGAAYDDAENSAPALSGAAAAQAVHSKETKEERKQEKVTARKRREAPPDAEAGGALSVSTLFSWSSAQLFRHGMAIGERDKSTISTLSTG